MNSRLVVTVVKERMSKKGKRKRVGATPIPRAPDGSAFQTCDDCGILVAIALIPMHQNDCKAKKKDFKRLKASKSEVQSTQQLNFQDQPRSGFRIFMESFLKTCEAENEIEADRKGFEKWKEMYLMERHPFMLQAERINEAYVRVLLEEAEKIPSVDDEADSADVWMFNEVKDKMDSADGENFSEDYNEFVFGDSDYIGRSES